MILHLTGQIRGGKNNVIVTRSGRRFPNPVFAKWRDSMMKQIDKVDCEVFSTPTRITVQYWHGDLLRRDVDALLGGIFHLLERSGIVKDDTLFKEAHWLPMGLDRKNPRATVQIEPLG